MKRVWEGIDLDEGNVNVNECVETYLGYWAEIQL
jgi:hypothetical protein